MTVNEMRYFKKLITDFDVNLITSKGLHIIIGDISIPIHIECPRNNKYNQNLRWVFPYKVDHEYKICTLLSPFA